jgi:hypothetical protein
LTSYFVVAVVAGVVCPKQTTVVAVVALAE